MRDFFDPRSRSFLKEDSWRLHAGEMLRGRVRFNEMLLSIFFRSVIFLVLIGNTFAAPVTWSGGDGATSNWSAGANWGGVAPVANDSLIFDGATRTTNTNNIGAGTQFNGITFANTASSFTLSGNTINLNGDILDNDTDLQTINLTLALQANTNINVVNGGSLTIGTAAIGGIITGASGVTINSTGSTGSVTFGGAGANTFTGGLTVNSGTLIGTTNIGAYGAASNDVTINAGATIDNRFNTRIDGLTGLGTVTNNGAANSRLDIGQGNASSTFDGTFANGTFVVNVGKVGTGTLTLTGLSTNTGTWAISGGGMLSINTLADTGSSALGISGGAGSTITINNGGGTLQYTGTTAGTTGRSIVMFNTGGGTASFDASGTGAGVLTLTNVDPNTASTSGTSILTLTGSNTGDNTVSSPLYNGGTAGVPIGGNVFSIVKNGAGKWVLSGANTYTGTTTINAGTLSISADNNFGGGSGTMSVLTSSTASTAVTLNAAPAASSPIAVGTAFLGSTIATIIDSTHFTLAGNANQTIAVATAVSYATTPTIVLDGGTLQSTGTFTLSETNGTQTSHRAISLANVVGGGTIGVTGANTLTVSGIVSGAGTLTKNDTGTLALTGANTYSAATTISAGAVNIQNATGLGTVAGGTTVSNNAALQLQGGITVGAEALTLNGTGVSNDGALRNISGTNTYGGLLTLGSASRINSDSGTLSLSNVGTITGAGLGLTVGGLSDTTISSILGTVNGTLTKDGAGILTLTGVNTTTGLATVSGGTLVVGTALGGSWAGGVTVDSGGTLKGRGTITGAVTINSGGTYSPGNSPAVQTVGTLTLNAGSNTIFEIDGATAGNGAGFHDQIIVTGAATINGGTITPQLVFSGSSGFVPTVGQTFVVISAASVTGQFTSVDNSANTSGLSLIPQYTGTTVYLLTMAGSLSSPSTISTLNLSPNQIVIGIPLDEIRPEFIDSSPGHTMSDAEKIYQSFGRLSASEIPSAIDQLSPEKLAAMPKLSQAVGKQIHGMVHRQLNLRRDWEEAQGDLSIYSKNGQLVYEPVAGILTDTMFARKNKYEGLSFFASVTGEQGEVAPSENRTNFDYTSATAVYGGNYSLSRRVNLGLFAGYGHSDTNLGGSGGEILYHTGRVGGYANWNWNNWFAESSVSVGKGFYDTERNITFLSEKAKGDTEAWEIIEEVRMGKDLSLGKWTISPTILGRYSRTFIEAFDEERSAARLHIKPLDQDSLVTGASVQVQRSIPLGKMSLVPRLYLNYEREWIRTGAMDARFLAGGSQFRITTDPVDQDQLTTGVGSSWIVSDQLQWDLAWEMEALQNDLQRQSVNVSSKFSF